MIPVHHLTDDDLIALGDHYAASLSFYVAGWDFPESAQREREAHRHCERLAKPVDAEMKRRGLKITRASPSSSRSKRLSKLCYEEPRPAPRSKEGPDD